MSRYYDNELLDSILERVYDEGVEPDRSDFTTIVKSVLEELEYRNNKEASLLLDELAVDNYA